MSAAPRIGLRLLANTRSPCTCFATRRALSTVVKPGLANSPRTATTATAALPAQFYRPSFTPRFKTFFHPNARHQSTVLSQATAGFEQAGGNAGRQSSTTHLAVSRHLFLVAGMVFSIVVVGGMTRLTESGLSITEWNLVTGVLPPLSETDWQVEFDKYKQSPEWRLQNQHITMDEFKRIFYWEWGHRVLGRAIGLAFLLPIPYFTYRRFLTRKTGLAMFGIGSLIGGQGLMGWYMVKSGLDDKSIEQLGGVARVSQYRLAAHLGLAFLVYVSCLRLGLGIARDSKLAKGLAIGGANDAASSVALLRTPQANRLRLLSLGVAGLVYMTALSGAFVAGLDAGLIYNDFPFMGGQLVPPSNEIWNDSYARKEDKSDKWWRNMLENPATAQLDHRILAMTTFASIVSLFMYARRPSIRPHVPPTSLRLIKATMHMSFLQVALGISTLWYLVPTHLAATHQAGSLVLLSLAVAAATSLRRPSASLRLMQQSAAAAARKA